jgi:hypothetical protein
LTPSFKTDKEHIKNIKHIVSEKKMFPFRIFS